MGRSYQAEPWVQEYFDSLLQRKVLAEVGLLFGKQAVGARDLILGIVPTPQQEGQDPFQVSLGNPGGKGGKKPTGQTNTAGGPASVSVLMLSMDWFVQHAEQVSRMLPGGISLLGFYVFCSDAGYQSMAAQQQWVVLQKLLEAQSTSGVAVTGQELAILHADSTSRKVTLRSSLVSPGASPTSPSLAELKWAPCMANLAQVRCIWWIDCELPAPSDILSLQAQLSSAVDRECSAITGAVMCLQDRTIHVPDSLVVDTLILHPLPTQGAGPAPLPASTVQLLPLQGFDIAGSDDGGGGQAGVVGVGGAGRLSGWMAGVTVVHKRQAWASVAQEVKADLCRSLRVRFDVLVEDALSWQQEQQEDAAGKGDASSAGGATVPDVHHPLLTQIKPLARPYATGLPRRVALALKGGIPVCDYLLPGEGLSETVGRTLDLLGGSLDLERDADKLEQQITTLESEVEAPKKLPPWTPGVMVGGTAVDASQGGKVPSSAVCNTTLLGGAAAGITLTVAVLVGLMSNMST